MFRQRTQHEVVVSATMAVLGVVIIKPGASLQWPLREIRFLRPTNQTATRMSGVRSGVPRRRLPS